MSVNYSALQHSKGLKLYTMGPFFVLFSQQIAIKI